MRNIIVKKTIKFRDNRRLTESEAFIYPVGIKSAQSVNSSHSLVLIIIIIIFIYIALFLLKNQ